MAITAGSDILAADFVSTSGGAGDVGRVAKLNSLGQIDSSFLLKLATTLVAGEALADKDAVCIGDGAQTGGPNLGSSNGTHGPTLSTTTWAAQSFVTVGGDISRITSYGMTVTNLTSAPNTFVWTAELQTDNAGTPSGTVIATGGSTDVVPNGALNNCTVNLGSPVVVSPGTKYWVVLKEVSHSGTIGFAGQFSGLVTFLGKTTANSGTSYTTEASNYIPFYSYEISTAGVGYKSNANSSNFRSTNFVGFNTGGAVAQAGTAKIITEGVADIFTGLTPGSVYYLSNSAGLIGTTPGGTSKKVGISVAATKLLIQNS